MLYFLYSRRLPYYNTRFNKLPVFYPQFQQVKNKFIRLPLIRSNWDDSCSDEWIVWTSRIIVKNGLILTFKEKLGRYWTPRSLTSQKQLPLSLRICSQALPWRSMGVTLTLSRKPKCNFCLFFLNFFLNPVQIFKLAGL